MRYQTPAEALEKLSSLRDAHEVLLRSVERRSDTKAVEELQAKIAAIDEKIQRLREADVAPSEAGPPA